MIVPVGTCRSALDEVQFDAGRGSRSDQPRGLECVASSRRQANATAHHHSGDRRAGALGCGGWFGGEGVDLLEQVAVAVEEAAVHRGGAGDPGHADLGALGGGAVELLYVNGQDLTAVQSTITSKLTQDPSFDTVFALQAPVAMRAVESVAQSGASADVATFDTNAELVGAIKDGRVAWAVDQQPYLQGYLAVDSLWIAKRNGGTLGGGRPVYTGPSFVDQSNVDTIEEAAKAGMR